MTAMITSEQAKQLPIRKYARQIADAVKDHPTVIVLGETGSGKTTQISQILLEAGFAADGQIAITQPRRVAAVTVAKRVAEELGVELGQEVGYSVRFEDCTSPSTKIKYLTDGTLLRECLDDAQLSKYSVIVLDEAHERSLSTDVLFGVVKKLVKERSKPLKLVVTSATLDGEKFSAYFDACPVFSVPGRCFPVDVIHSLEDHTSNYVDAAVDTVLQLHTQQPSGDILVFLTGQAEIEKCINKLTQAIVSFPADTCGPLLLLPLYASLPPEMQVRVFRPPAQGTRRCIIATNVAETSVTVDGVVFVVDSGMVKIKSHVPNTGMDSLDVTPTSRVGATQRAGRAGRTQPGKCFRLYTKQFFDRHMPDVTPPEIQRTSLAGTVLHLKSLALDIDVLRFDFLDPPSRAALEDALRTLYLLDALDDAGQLTETGRAMAALPLEPGLARCLLAAVDLKCLPEALTVAAMLSHEHIFEQGRSPADYPRSGSGSGGGGDNAQQRGRNAGDHGGPRGPSAKLKSLIAEGLGDHVVMLRMWDLWSAADYDKRALRDLGLDLRSMNFVRDVRRQLEGIMSSYIASARKRQRIEPNDNGRGGDDKRRRVRSRSPDIGGDHIGGVGDSGKEHKNPMFDDAAREERSRRRSPVRSGCGSFEDPLKRYPFATEQARVRALTQAITIGFVHKLARRLPRHNGYRTLGTGVQVGGGQLAQLHPASAGLKEDADGLLPQWVVYHELVSTSRPFLRQVCATEYAFVEPLLGKITKIDVARLSRGRQGSLSGAVDAAAAAAGATAAAVPIDGAATGSVGKAVVKRDTAAVDAVRQRYLQRKAQGGK